ncbi:MAG: hypothetical protein LUD15_14100 [Bacteroides sp.]|nr:hypothetical protein [Bacteroides sp.]
MEQIMDETNDTLTDYKAILIRKALREPGFMDEEHTIMWHYRFRKLTQKEGENYRERYFDTTVYIEIEDEFEPVRWLRTCFRDSNGDYHELELMISTVERDDMIQAIVLYLVILYSLFVICTLWGTRIILKKVFSPLTSLLGWLNKVTPGKPVPPLQNKTPVEEFQRLNEAALSLSRRSEEAYQQQKEFIENASHELQTPLAVARAKIELLAEEEELTEEQLRNIDDIYRTIGRAVKLNKSLLLLTRISNRQHGEIKQISLAMIVQEILSGLSEIYENRSLQISYRE